MPTEKVDQPLKVEDDASIFKTMILTLDGGGIRGYSSLLILDALMKKVGEIEGQLAVTPLPHKYFDLIVGASTGGLIALMLGRLRMPVEERLEEYGSLGKDIFAKKRPPGRFSRYDYRKLEWGIKSVIRRYGYGGHPDIPLRETGAPPSLCRTAVVAVRERASGEAADQPHLFRSYLHQQHNMTMDPNRVGEERNPVPPDSVTVPSVLIWQAARATSAAPTYFRMIKIGDHCFMDGGVVANNPCFEAWNEARSMQPTGSEENGLNIAGLVSLGTGKAASLTLFTRGRILTRLLSSAKYCFKNLTDPEKSHEKMYILARDTHTPYFRFNVEKGLENMNMGECIFEGGTFVTINKLRAATERYLALQAVQSDLDDCARRLVEHRRHRDAAAG